MESRKFKVELSLIDGEDAFPDRQLVVSPESPVHLGRSSDTKRIAAAADNGWIGNPVISRNHARLSVESNVESANPDNSDGYHVTVSDDGSMHGTFVNYRKVGVRGSSLECGDELRLGQDITREDATFKAPTYFVRITRMHQDQQITGNLSSSQPQPQPAETSKNTFSVPDTWDSDMEDSEYSSGGQEDDASDGPGSDDLNSESSDEVQILSISPRPTKTDVVHETIISGDLSDDSADEHSAEVPTFANAELLPDLLPKLLPNLVPQPSTELVSRASVEAQAGSVTAHDTSDCRPFATPASDLSHTSSAEHLPEIFTLVAESEVVRSSPKRPLVKFLEDLEEEKVSSGAPAAEQRNCEEELRPPQKRARSQFPAFATGVAVGALGMLGGLASLPENFFA